MKAAEMREKTQDELTELEASLRRQIWKVRFDNLSNQLDDTSSIRKLRRDLARVKTLLTQRTRAPQ